MLAQAMKYVTRKSDILARPGGEEFCILLPETNSEKSMIVIKRLRKKFTELQKTKGLTEKYPKLEEVTISAGVNFLNDINNQPQFKEKDGDPKDYKTFLNQADQALYAAKNTGRNRVIIYGSEEFKEYLKTQTDSTE